MWYRGLIYLYLCPEVLYKVVCVLLLFFGVGGVQVYLFSIIQLTQLHSVELSNREITHIFNSF